MVTAAGGLPRGGKQGLEGKRFKHFFDCEFGHSCMGYEIAGGWG